MSDEKPKPLDETELRRQRTWAEGKPNSSVARLLATLDAYKAAVTDQLHYDMREILSGTPERRRWLELHAAREENARLRGLLEEAATELEVCAAVIGPGSYRDRIAKEKADRIRAALEVKP